MSKKGFTLIELLVVITIIALLLTGLTPALSKVKTRAKTVVCMVNCKSLATAWGTYAKENGEAIVSSFTGYADYGSELVIPADPADMLCANPWVGWAGYPDSSSAGSVENKERQTQAIKQGKLYPYLGTTEAYRCPESKKYILRSYSIPDILGNKAFEGHATLGGQTVVTKIAQIKAPASRIVFLDEGFASYAGYTMYYNAPLWWDLPPVRHDNGVTLGYVDGHADFYKWQDQRTILTGENGYPSGPQPDNPDLMMMQRGAFGSIGY